MENKEKRVGPVPTAGGGDLLQEVTYLPHGINETQPVAVTLEWLLGHIATDAGLQHLTGLARQAFQGGNVVVYGQLKKQAPAIVPAVLLQGGTKKEHVQRLTGMGMVDIDHVPPQQMAETIQLLKEDAHTLLQYVTLSGEGLRVLFRYAPPTGAIPWDEDYYQQAWAEANGYYATLCGLPADDSVKNMNRLSFLCHDPEAYLNLQAVPFAVPIPLKHLSPTLRRAACATRDPFRLATDYLSRYRVQYVQGNRHNYLFRLACTLNRYGVPEEEALQGCLLHGYLDDDSETTTRHTIHSAYSSYPTQHGTLSYLLTPTACPGRPPLPEAKPKPTQEPKEPKEPKPTKEPKAKPPRPHRPTPQEVLDFVLRTYRLRRNVVSHHVQILSTAATPSAATGTQASTPAAAETNPPETAGAAMGTQASTPAAAATNVSPTAGAEACVPEKPAPAATNLSAPDDLSLSDLWQDLTDQDVNSLTNAMLQTGTLRLRTDDVWRVLNSNLVPPYHPFSHYLATLPPWDGYDYIGAVARRITCDVPQLLRTALERFLVALMRGVLAAGGAPATPNQMVLTLLGPQGRYKSTFFALLLPPPLQPYFLSKQRPSRLSKDDLFALAENALICLDEISLMSTHDYNTLKSFITTPAVHARPAYGRLAENHPRIASFCATGNDRQFLSDPTGNRRWMPFWVTDILSPIDHPLPYTGLYSQVKHLMQNPAYRCYYTPAETAELQPYLHTFEAPNYEEELLLNLLRPPKEGETGRYLSATEIAVLAYRTARVTLSAALVGRALNHLGYTPPQTPRPPRLHRGPARRRRSHPPAKHRRLLPPPPRPRTPPINTPHTMTTLLENPNPIAMNTLSQPNPHTMTTTYYYTLKELAVAYDPSLTARGASAKLRRAIRRTPGLLPALEATGFRIGQHNLYPAQQDIIYHYLGPPLPHPQ